jgi:hypothetical protein
MGSIPCVRELYNYLLGKKKSAHTVFYLPILLDGLHAFYFVCAEYQTSCVVITCFLIDIISYCSWNIVGVSRVLDDEYFRVKYLMNLLSITNIDRYILMLLGTKLNFGQVL